MRIYFAGASPLRPSLFAKFDSERKMLCDVFAIRASIAQHAFAAPFAQGSRSTPARFCKKRRFAFHRIVL